MWYLAEGDDNHTGTEPAVLSVRIAAPVVSYHHEAGDTVWTMGSDQGLALTFKRSFDDKTTIDHFEGVAVDGKELKGDADYTVQSGSVIVTLQPAYLKTLSKGAHTLEVRFDDAEPVSVDLTVRESSGNGGPGSTDGDKNDSKDGDSSSKGTTDTGLAYSPFGLGWPSIPPMPTIPVFRDRAPLSNGAALPTTTSGSTATGTSVASPSVSVGTPVGSGTGAITTDASSSVPTPVSTVSPGPVASAETGAQATGGETASAVPAAKTPTAATGDPTLAGVVIPMAVGGLALAAAGHRRRQR